MMDVHENKRIFGKTVVYLGKKGNMLITTLKKNSEILVPELSTYWLEHLLVLHLVLQYPPGGIPGYHCLYSWPPPNIF